MCVVVSGSIVDIDVDCGLRWRMMGICVSLEL